MRTLVLHPHRDDHLSRKPRSFMNSADVLEKMWILVLYPRGMIITPHFRDHMYADSVNPHHNMAIQCVENCNKTPVSSLYHIHYPHTAYVWDYVKLVVVISILCEVCSSYCYISHGDLYHCVQYTHNCPFLLWASNLINANLTPDWAKLNNGSNWRDFLS